MKLDDEAYRWNVISCAPAVILWALAMGLDLWMIWG